MSSGRQRDGAPRPPRPQPDHTNGDRGDRDDHSDCRAASQIGFPVSAVRPPSDRGLSVAATIVALAIGLAVLKPWAAPTSNPPVAAQPELVAATPASPGSAAPTPRPTDDSPEGLAGPVCLGASGWRIASLETWRDQDVRVWRAIEPIAAASGPLDTSIPTVPVVGSRVRALGWCAPAFGPDRPDGPADVRGWIVIDGVAHDLALRQVLPARGTTHLAALYVPVAACELGAACSPEATGLVPQPWVAGRVVFRYDDEGTLATAWLAVDVELYATAGPSAPPAAPASPAG